VVAGARGASSQLGGAVASTVQVPVRGARGTLAARRQASEAAIVQAAVVGCAVGREAHGAERAARSET
jgi:hypothetical protein